MKRGKVSPLKSTAVATPAPAIPSTAVAEDSQGAAAASSASSSGGSSGIEVEKLESSCSRRWRILTTQTTSGSYIWDVYRVQFVNLSGGNEIAQEWLDSSHYDDGFSPRNVDPNDARNRHRRSPWGGRRDKETKELYIGAVFAGPVNISLVKITQGFDHRACHVHVQRYNEHDMTWTTVQTVKECGQLVDFTIAVSQFDDNEGEDLFLDEVCDNSRVLFSNALKRLVDMGFDEDASKQALQDTDGDIDDALGLLSANDENEHKSKKMKENLEDKYPLEEFVTTPSMYPVRIPPHDVSLKSRLHPPREQEFVPSTSFYNSICLDGLWICTSKSVEDSVLQACAELIKRVIPIDQRRLWGKFRSPLWAKDPGPMRIIILDNRTDEQAGIIPELQDGSKGRNGTSCPFVFTSREDFVKGIGSGAWPLGKLTMHESAHGADMVIRQLIDPYFNEMANDLYLKSRSKYRTTKGKKMYAASSRDEYVAECLTIILDMVETSPSSDYKQASLSCLEEILEKDPDIVQFLSQYFNTDVDKRMQVGNGDE